MPATAKIAISLITMQGLFLHSATVNKFHILSLSALEIILKMNDSQKCDDWLFHTKFTAAG